jgi:hypothetical protein
LEGTITEVKVTTGPAGKNATQFPPSAFLQQKTDRKPGPVMDAETIRAGLESHDRALYIKAGWIRDPYITLAPDDFYYLTGTQPREGDPREAADPYNIGLGDESIVGDQVRLWRSRDLIEWESLGPIFTVDDTVQARSGANIPRRLIWAPEVHWLPEFGDNGRWALLHCPASHSSLALSAGRELKGPWTHPMEDRLGRRHDPSLFQDDDGTWYLLWGNTLIAPLSSDFSRYIAEPVRIDPAGSRTNALGETKSVIGHEGATMIKVGGKYVHLGTAWSTDQIRKGSYNLYYCVADRITGPYGPRKFAGRFLGHGTPFQTRDGKWWCTAFFNANVPPLPREGIETRDLSENAQTINEQGVTIVPLDVRVLDDGNIFLRAKDPAYASPGPDEVQRFDLEDRELTSFDVTFEAKPKAAGESLSVDMVRNLSPSSGNTNHVQRKSGMCAGTDWDLDGERIQVMVSRLSTGIFAIAVIAFAAAGAAQGLDGTVEGKHCEKCHSPSWLVRAEYLLWWTRGMTVPALATTGNTADSLPSALGQPNTQILFGDAALNDEVRPGGRITLSRWLDPCQNRAIEVSYLTLGDKDTTFGASNHDFAVLGRPFLNATRNAQDARLIANPGTVSGTLEITATTEFQSLEVLYRQVCARSCNAQLDCLIGYRAAELEDRLRIGESTLSLASPTVGTTFDLVDRFDSRNTFHGGEVGLVLLYRADPCWSWEAVAKVAIGTSNYRAGISGQTVAEDNLGDIVTSERGLLTQGTNVGTYRWDDFATVSEFGITLRRDLSRGLSATVGYSLLYWSNVARAGEQVDSMVNPTQIPPGTLVGEARPAFPFRTTDFWAQGLRFGIEYHF